MTVQTIHACNLCGLVSDQYVRGFVFNTDDSLRVVATTETPMHVCHGCFNALGELWDAENKTRSE